jgi:tetratricopeptide (TPR) repeat protein
MKYLAILIILILPTFSAKAVGQITIERKERAIKALDQAAQLAEAERHSAIRAELLASLAIVYVKLGEKEKGDAFLTRSRQLIEEDDDLTKDCYECPSKEFFRILLAIDHAQAGYINQALEMLEQLVRIDKQRQTDNHGRMLAGLASVFAGIGNTERALELMDEAFDLAITTDDEIDRSVALEESAKRYALLGQLERAMRVADTMGKGPFKDHALIAIARKYAESGRFDRALAINKQIETTNFKPDILIFVARRYLDRGEREKAIALLRKAFGASGQVTASNPQQFALSDVALLFAKAGQYDQAIQIVKATDAQAPKLRLLTQLAYVFAQAGKKDAAEKLLSEAYQLTSFSSGTYFQARDIVEVANAYAAIGKNARATSLLAVATGVLDAIKDPTNKGLIFSNIAVSYLLLGDDNSAFRMADRIEVESNVKLFTLLEIASRYSEAEQLMRMKDRLTGELMQP